MKYLLSIILVLFVCGSATANELNCGNAGKLTDLVNDSVVIFLGSPVGGYKSENIDLQTYQYVYETPSRFRVWKTYRGETSDYENMHYSAFSQRYRSNGLSVVFGTRVKKGTVSSTNCGGHEFNRKQIIDFFEYGIESQGLSNYCAMKIKQAYDTVEILSEFKLDEPKCCVEKPVYDTRYRRDQKVDFACRP